MFLNTVYKAHQHKKTVKSTTHLANEHGYYRLLEDRY